MPAFVNPFTGAAFLFKEKTGSTMEDAREYIESGCVHGSVIATGFQERGRGRFPERGWEGETGRNLLFSLILKKEKLVPEISLLPLTAGLAVSETIMEMYGIETAIKWPNDVLWQGKKISGILCEVVDAYVIAGIGINCNQRRFPEKLAEKAVSLAAITGKEIIHEELLECFLSRMKVLIESEDISARVGERLLFKGESITVSLGIPGKNQCITGECTGVSKRGELLLYLPERGREHPIASGEIILH